MIIIILASLALIGLTDWCDRGRCQTVSFFLEPCDGWNAGWKQGCLLIMTEEEVSAGTTPIVDADVPRVVRV